MITRSSNNKTEYYVYAHVRKSGIPFYVGKGSKNRAYTDARNEHWRRVTNKDYPDCKFPKVVIIYDGLTEDDAIALERYKIALWGRVGVHSGGLLVNKTDGGEGVSGLVHSVSSKKMMSSSHRGKIHSEETRRKMSLAHEQNNKPGTIISPDGVEYIVTNKEKFAKRWNLRAGWLGAVINGTRKSHKGWHLKKNEKPKVKLTTPTGDVVEVSLTAEFCRNNNVSQGNMYRVVSEHRKSHKGWRLYTV